MSAFAVELSQNAKIGPTHATYASQQSCPKSCPFQGAGCYAEHGLVRLHTQRVNTADANATPMDVARIEAEAIRKTLSGRHDLRLHVVGDCSTDEAASLVSDAALSVLKPGRKAWTYTHASRDVQRESWGELSVLASCETTEQVRAAQDAGWATAIVVPEFKGHGLQDYGGIKLLPCVNQTKGAQCVECRLCMDDARLRDKGITIGFVPHSSGAKKVTRILPVLN